MMTAMMIIIVITIVVIVIIVIVVVTTTTTRYRQAVPLLATLRAQARVSRIDEGKNGQKIGVLGSLMLPDGAVLAEATGTRTHAPSRANGRVINGRAILPTGGNEDTRCKALLQRGNAHTRTHTHLCVHTHTHPHVRIRLCRRACAHCTWHARHG